MNVKKSIKKAINYLIANKQFGAGDENRTRIATLAR